MDILNVLIQLRNDIIEWATNNFKNKVPITRKINGKALSADVTLTVSDISEAATTTSVGTLSDTVNSHISDTTVHITAAERTTWNDAKTKLDLFDRATLSEVKTYIGIS